MNFDLFYSSFSFSSSLFFSGGKWKGEENNQSRDQKSCLSARSILQLSIVINLFLIKCKNLWKVSFPFLKIKNVVSFSLSVILNCIFDENNIGAPKMHLLYFAPYIIIALLNLLKQKLLLLTTLLNFCIGLVHWFLTSFPYNSAYA